MNLFEGGNVFKQTSGEPATQRINQADVETTVRWLEKLTGLNLVDNMLGTTGKKETSGDLDLAVDAAVVSKDVLIKHLLNRGIPASDIKKSGDNVHLKTPINGNPELGHVQTDFMFGDPKWQHFSLQGSPAGSPFKGVHRHLLLASIAKAQGMKWSYKNGLMDRATNQVISQNPTEIAQTLFNGSAEDLNSVEHIVAAIRGRSDYEQLIADARTVFARDNLTIPGEEKLTEGSAAWFTHWKTRL